MAFLPVLSACTSIIPRSKPTNTPFPWPTATQTGTPTPTITPRPTLTSIPIIGADCPVPDLTAWQHISASGSYTETETSAAGPMICQIEPGSCAYNLLVGNLDTGVIFKREETPPYDAEDILMHPAILLPLFRLQKLVEVEWGGEAQLRVTDAYDSLMEHDLAQPNPNRKNSLHFEGRSIDLTTWPIDQTRYGRLCALAYCAGFDWVQNEIDHCHASVNASSLCSQCQN